MRESIEAMLWPCTARTPIEMLIAFCLIIYLNMSHQQNCMVFTARQGDLKWKKILKDSGWCDKNGLNESFKMSPHLICLNWGINFHITSRPDPEAGHKRDLRPQLRHIKWGLILKLSMRLFSWHSPKFPFRVSQPPWEIHSKTAKSNAKQPFVLDSESWFSEPFAQQDLWGYFWGWFIFPKLLPR